MQQARQYVTSAIVYIEMEVETRFVLLSRLGTTEPGDFAFWLRLEPSENGQFQTFNACAKFAHKRTLASSEVGVLKALYPELPIQIVRHNIEAQLLSAPKIKSGGPFLNVESKFHKVDSGIWFKVISLIITNYFRLIIYISTIIFTAAINQDHLWWLLISKI